jgi:hypothetical protein
MRRRLLGGNEFCFLTGFQHYHRLIGATPARTKYSQAAGWTVPRDGGNRLPPRGASPSHSETNETAPFQRRRNRLEIV